MSEKAILRGGGEKWPTRQGGDLETASALTKDEWSQLFRLIDDYSRRRLNCLVTEFFLSREKAEYFLCFRPLGVTNKNSPNRFTCEYVTVSLEEARKMAHDNALTVDFIEELDRRVSALGQLA
jgi:hypothetical protein